MESFTLSCSGCKKRVYRSRGRINEAKKFGWKTYCSKTCQTSSRFTGNELTCPNPHCNKTFYRPLNQTYRFNQSFCSRSCAATVNNSKFPKRRAATFQCAYCHQQFKGHRIYCSRTCKNQSQTISATEIIKGIQEFHKKRGRIPIKIEFPHYGAAQERFDSWNKAIVAAGFNPNPVMFAQRHIANDGHECDSFAEKVIDDWLTEKNIAHTRKAPYPSNRILTADFLIDDKLIEYFGLAGVLKDYDKLIQEKRRIVKKYGLKLIEIYPKNLFPKNCLSEVLKT